MLNTNPALNTAHHPNTQSTAIELLARALLLVATGHALCVLFLGLGKPLLDFHSFRQTQTALTSYWILQGGSWLSYETPVLGAPWAIPFEFPIFQLLAATLSLLGIPLDAAGRIVAFGFFLAALWPLRIIYEHLKLGRAAYVATSVLFLGSPLYLYWSRTFLVESCALFFALLWLSLLVRYLDKLNWSDAVAASAVGCFAILAKSTTFPPFVALGCILIAVFGWRKLSGGIHRSDAVRLGTTLALVLGVPFAVGLVWVKYSDSVKTGNEFGSYLTSAALGNWNFGTLQQRLSPDLWVETIWTRVLPDTLGTFSLLAFVVVGATLTSWRFALAALVSVSCFLIPFLIFTNLHIIHNYYQNANAIFLIAAVGVGIGRIFNSSMKGIAIVILAIIMIGQLQYFYTRFAPPLTADYSNNRLWRISEIAKNATNPGQSLVVIGDDWSSTVPYYAERKSIVIPNWISAPLMERVLASPQEFSGDQTFGGIVYCADQLPKYHAMVPAIERFVAGRAVIGEFGGCQFLSPMR